MASDFIMYKNKFRIRKFFFLPMERIYELCTFITNRHYLLIPHKLQMYTMEAKCHYSEVQTEAVRTIHVRLGVNKNSKNLAATSKF
jgi:hypothetical protein